MKRSMIETFIISFMSLSRTNGSVGGGAQETEYCLTFKLRSLSTSIKGLHNSSPAVPIVLLPLHLQAIEPGVRNQSSFHVFTSIHH